MARSSSRASSPLTDLFVETGQSPQVAEQEEQQRQEEHMQWPATRHIWLHIFFSFVIS